MKIIKTHHVNGLKELLEIPKNEWIIYRMYRRLSKEMNKKMFDNNLTTEEIGLYKKQRDILINFLMNNGWDKYDIWHSNYRVYQRNVRDEIFNI
jgi:hypothetical protein